MGLLDGKVAIITGSGRGIGQGIALKFVKEGAKVVINDIDAAPCNETVEMVKKIGGKAIGCVADVTNPTQVKKMVDDCVKAFGTVDILVNNAGLTRDAMIHNMDDKLLRLIININLKGTHVCTQAVLPILQDAKKKGEFKKIVNFASTTGISGNVGQANYAIAKGGIVAYTKSCAREFALDRICVNSVAPGFIETRMTAVKKAGESMGIPEAIRNMAISAIPFGRGGLPEDVANIILFLCSPLSDWISGELLSIDGAAYV